MYTHYTNKCFLYVCFQSRHEMVPPPKPWEFIFVWSKGSRSTWMGMRVSQRTLTIIKAIYGSHRDSHEQHD